MRDFRNELTGADNVCTKSHFLKIRATAIIKVAVVFHFLPIICNG